MPMIFMRKLYIRKEKRKPVTDHHFRRPRERTPRSEMVVCPRFAKQVVCPRFSRGRNALLALRRFLAGRLRGGHALLDRALDRVVDLLVDRGEVVVGALGGGDRGPHVGDDRLAAGGRVLVRLFQRREGGGGELLCLLLEGAPLLC